jgi:hypothetical protein
MTQQAQLDTSSLQNATGPTVSQSSQSNNMPISIPQLSVVHDQSRSADVGALIAALAKAQGAIGDIERNRTVTVRPKSGGQEYSFRYATLSAIFTAIKKPLADNGIGYTQVISHDAYGGFYVLTTTIYHGNQFISSKVPLIAEGGSNQQFGSALTYMKRYALAALLGIAADEDDDGNAADGNEIKSLADKPTKAAPPKPPAPDAIKDKINIIPPRDYPPEHLETSFSNVKIDVPLLADESGSDWMTWGQTLMAQARQAPDAESLKKLEQNNSIPMKNMEISAPKMYTNMTLALIMVRKALEKTNA